jgi:hypothetical protein
LRWLKQFMGSRVLQPVLARTIAQMRAELIPHLEELKSAISSQSAGLLGLQRQTDALQGELASRSAFIPHLEELKDAISSQSAALSEMKIFLHALQSQTDDLKCELASQSTALSETKAFLPANLSYRFLIGDLPPSPDPPTISRRKSELCRQQDFTSDAFRYWCAQMHKQPLLHRKFWEYFYVAQALHERGKLAAGNRGLGFAVGQEPLPALFASRGCEILATDQRPEEAEQGGWARTNEYSGCLEKLCRFEICQPQLFYSRVGFRFVDMNEIAEDLLSSFDFCWSICSFEHLGSLEHGIRFVENSVKMLKPGGVAVHTTEFNLSSNVDTIERPEISIYRKRDVEELASRLVRAGHDVEPLNFDAGNTLVDGRVDVPPYRLEPHIRLLIDGYSCTSFGLIVSRRT